MNTQVDPLSRMVLDKFSRMVTCRAAYEKDWGDIRRLVRPYGKDFFKASTIGDSQVTDIYDGTAPDALEDLAAGFQSFWTSSVTRWFGVDLEMLDPEERMEEATRKWLERASNSVYGVYSDDKSAFNQTLHEALLDAASFGTGFMLQENDDESSPPFFVARPAACCYIEENYKGFVDTVYDLQEFTNRQIFQKFPDAPFTPEQKAAMEKDLMETCEVIHATEPREGYEPKDAEMAKEKAFRSCWVHKDSGVLLRESGFNEFPWHVIRWVKLSGEVYGRSPATKCLPDIRMLNQLARAVIRATEKIIDPPLIVEDDSIVGKLKTSPNSIISKIPGSPSPEPLVSGANIPVTLELVNEVRDRVRKCFHSDWLKMDKAKLEMTATEVMDRRDEKLRFITPISGRVNSETFGPMVMRTLRMQIRARRIPPFPEQVEKNQLRIKYVSSAAKAQLGTEANDITRFLQDLIPMAQVDPQVFDSVKLDVLAARLALARSIPRDAIRADEELDAYRQSRAEEKSIQQAADIAKPMSEAANNVASAQSKGLDIMSMLGQ